MQRFAYIHERALTDSLRQRPGNAGVEHQVGVATPAWWPQPWQARYHELFDRPCYFYSSGDTDLASRHGGVVVLRETAIHPSFRPHLRQMTRLEALDLSFVRMPYADATRQGTVLRDLTPLPNLRGINLSGTNATDADMQWLAACQRLEVIDLSATKIGDQGLARLAPLPDVRRLKISSPRISDECCKSIARLRTLEELSLASTNVRTEAAILELAGLPKLKRLDLSVGVSEAALDELRRRLPECKVNSRRY
jgi:hypothetical protein